MAHKDDVPFGQETVSKLQRSDVPDYAPRMAAYHRACARELRTIVDGLPLVPGSRILDMACGDGTYLGWLAERVGADGEVIGIDIEPAYLEFARQRIRESQHAGVVKLEIGNIEGLPFADDSFDLVWCAHSLYSLPDPVAALQEMRRVTRSGGTVAILENDTLHHMLLPWPPELELAVRQAQLKALQQDAQDVDKFYVGRDILGVFAAAGLVRRSVTTYTIDRSAPLSPDEQLFLQEYLRELRDRAHPYLARANQQAFERLLDPQAADYLLNGDNFWVSVLEIVVLGFKP